MVQSFGYYEYPKNSNGIIRARTTGQLRSWSLPRKLKALEVLHREFGRIDFPGVYILFHETKKEVYVGEAKSLYNRLKTHIQTPEDKIKGWQYVLVINDGRPATQSDFNDTVIRKSLELYLIKLLMVNKYIVLSQGEAQRHNPVQQTTVDSLKSELDFFLLKKNIIYKLIEKKIEEEILIDDLRRILEQKGYSINKWGAKNAIINGNKAFIRPGSRKTRGWQVTIRGKKPGSFIDSLQNGEGYLLMPRGDILLIPLDVVQNIIEQQAYSRDTIDIYVNFKEDKIELSYKNNTMNVTQFKILS